MKKLLILALVLVVAGGLFAQVTVSGQVNYGTLMKVVSDGNTADGPTHHWDNRVIVTAKFDDFTKAIVRLRSTGQDNGSPDVFSIGAAQNGGTRPSALTPWLNRAYIESDIAGVLGLSKMGVSNVLAFGMYNAANHYIADGAFVADVTSKDFGGTTPAMSNVLSIMKMVNVRVLGVFGDPEENIGTTSSSYTGGVLVGIDGGYGPVTVGFDWTNIGAYKSFTTYGTNNGVITFAAKYMQPFGDLTVTGIPNFAYDMDAEQSKLGIIARLAYKTMANVQLGFLGFSKLKNAVANTAGAQDSWFNRLEARVVLMPIDLFSLDIGTVLNMDQDYKAFELTVGGEKKKSILNDLDVRANLHLNKTTTFSVGYLLLGVDGYSSAVNYELYRVGYANVKGLGGLILETKATF